MKKTYIKAEMEITESVIDNLYQTVASDLSTSTKPGSVDDELAKGRYSDEDYDMPSAGQESYGDLW